MPQMEKQHQVDEILSNTAQAIQEMVQHDEHKSVLVICAAFILCCFPSSHVYFICSSIPSHPIPSHPIPFIHSSIHSFIHSFIRIQQLRDQFTKYLDQWQTQLVQGIRNEAINRFQQLNQLRFTEIEEDSIHHIQEAVKLASTQPILVGVNGNADRVMTDHLQKIGSVFQLQLVSVWLAGGL